MSLLSEQQIKVELQQLKDEVAKVTPQQEMRYVRPPRGIFNERVLQVSNDNGYTNVFWSIAYKDWDTNVRKGWQYAYKQVVDQLHPGAVILLHSVSKDNADAIGKIIDEARRQGYVFKSLDELTIKQY